jgi:pentatricopeptide repeat protein
MLRAASLYAAAAWRSGLAGGASSASSSSSSSSSFRFAAARRWGPLPLLQSPSAAAARGISVTAAQLGRNDGNTIRLTRNARITVAAKAAQRREAQRKQRQQAQLRNRPHPKSQGGLEAATAAKIRSLPASSQQRRVLVQSQRTKLLRASVGAGGGDMPAARAGADKMLVEDMDTSFLQALEAPFLFAAGGSKQQQNKQRLLAVDTDKLIVELGRGERPASPRAFNEIMRAQAVQGKAVAALRTYERLLQSGLKPSRGTYQALLYACSLGGMPDLAASVVEQLAKAGGDQPVVEPRYYTLLAQAYVRSGRLDDAFQVVRTAERHAEARRLSGAVAAVAGAAIAAGAPSGVADPANVARVMVASSSGGGGGGGGGGGEGGGGGGLGRPEGYGAVPGLEPPLFTALILGCMKARDYRRAWVCFDRMRIYHASPDVPCLGAIIGVCARSGATERALDLWNEFALLGLQPDLQCFNAVIHACSRSWRYAPRAFDMYSQMRTAGFAPSAHTLNSLLHSCTHAGDLKRATAILSIMRRSRGSLRPTALTYAT